MKKNFLKSLGLGLMVLVGTSASAQCLNTNGDMETFTSPVSGGNSWINNHLTNWKVSHGTPSVGTSPSTNMWMWSYNGYGEGLYTDYNFVAGETYEICYDILRDPGSNPTSEFRVELATGLTPWTGGIFGPIPVPTTSQSLTSQPWVDLGVWVTITETFVATSSFNQLWLYPYLAGKPTPDQAEVRLDNVCIKKYVVDPCDWKPEFKWEALKCDMHFLNVTSVPAGFTVLNTSWDFGDGSTGTGDDVHHFYTTDGIYKVCMTVWMVNKDGDCCKQTVCYEVKAEGCDPCEWLEEVYIKWTGSNPYTFSALGFPIGMYDVLGFHWSFGDGNYGTGANPTHTYTTPGTYDVCVRVYYYDEKAEKCCNISFCEKIEVVKCIAGDHNGGPINNDDLISMDKPSASPVSIFPNPSEGVFNIEMNEVGSVNTITVYDQAGKVSYSITDASKSGKYKLDLSSLEKGAYIVVINESDDATRSFEKVVIQ